LARKKNLSKDDLEDVSIYEEINQRKFSTYDPNKIRINDISIELKCLQKKQKDLRRAIEEKDVVIANGAPGTGKTYMSLATALHILKTEPKYKKIILIKSLQIIKGEEIGYLPGTLWEKLEPYMYSFIGNLDKIVGSSKITKALLNQGIIEIYPIAYIRGVTLDNCMLPGTTILISDNEEIKIEKLYDLFFKNIDNDKKIFVKSYNFKENVIEDKELNAISKNPILDNEDVYEIKLTDGRLIKLTGYHKLYVKNKGYIEVGDLIENDILLNYNNFINEIKIQSIRKMDPSEYDGLYKYSINVKDNHNYFLNNGVLSKNCIVIVDESQNIDMHTFKTIITRIGNNCKMIFLGDSEQIDRKFKNESCLSKVSELFKNFEYAASVTFTKEESVRNPIIPKLLELLQTVN